MFWAHRPKTHSSQLASIFATGRIRSTADVVKQFQNPVDTFSLIQLEERSILGTEGVNITGRREIALLRLMPFQPQASSLTQ
jgi:hypothetical protein